MIKGEKGAMSDGTVDDDDTEADQRNFIGCGSDDDDAV